MDTIDLHEYCNGLDTTDSLSNLPLTLDGSQNALLSLPPGWNVGLKDKDPAETVDVEFQYVDSTYTMSKEAVLSLLNAFGLTPSYVTRTPGVLISSHANYWLKNSPDLTLKMLATTDKHIMSVGKDGIVPFQNSDLATFAASALAERFNLDSMKGVRASSLSSHSLNSTAIRLVVPSEANEMTFKHGGSYINEVVTPGIQIMNSLTGKHPLTVGAFLQFGDSGIVFPRERYNRKTQGQDISEVMEWVRSATFEHSAADMEIEALMALGKHGVPTGALAGLLADIFKNYKIPLGLRSEVTDGMVKSEDYTYFGVVRSIMNSVTKNENDQIAPHVRTNVMEIAGLVAEDSDHRCDSCQKAV